MIYLVLTCETYRHNLDLLSTETETNIVVVGYMIFFHFSCMQFKGLFHLLIVYKVLSPRKKSFGPGLHN